jgi:hypothetical protein
VVNDELFRFDLLPLFLSNVASSVLEGYMCDAYQFFVLSRQWDVFDKDISTFSVCVHISIVDVSEGV